MSQILSVEFTKLRVQAIKKEVNLLEKEATIRNLVPRSLNNDENLQDTTDESNTLCGIHKA